MKKTSIILLMAVLVNLIATATSYASCEFVVKDKTIVEYSGSSENVIIPAHIAGEDIIGIESGAFKDNSNIKTVTIEEGVEFIAPYAFDNCDNLEEVNCPESIMSVAPTSISGCDSFYNLNASIDILEQSAMMPQISFFAQTVVVDGFEVLDNAIIKYVGDDTEVVIPSTINDITITTISANAFKGNTNITSIQIPQTITSIGAYAFMGCSALTSIDIPSSVTSIGTQALCGCKNLTEINVDDENSKYCDVDGVLFDKNKTQIICYPIGKTDEEYTIPDTVTVIATYAFYECTSLRSITLQEGLLRMGTYAFQYCSNLENIDIPSTLQNINVWAFGYCKNLKHIEIPYSITSLGSAAFYYCTSLNNVAIPDTVTKIISHCFRECWSLTDIKLPNSLSYIDNDVFVNCGFSTIKIPDSVTSIGTEAFWRCMNLTEITIPNNVTALGIKSFNGCTALTNITIPESVTTIGNDAFSNCTKLTDVYYGGCEAKWNKISIGTNNQKLTDATIHCAKNNYSHKISDYIIGENSLTVNASVENNTDLSSVSMLAVYNKSGALKGLDIKTDFDDSTVDFIIDNYTYADGDYAKLFMWDSLSDISSILNIEQMYIVYK